MTRPTMEERHEQELLQAAWKVHSASAAYASHEGYEDDVVVVAMVARARRYLAAALRLLEPMPPASPCSWPLIGRAQQLAVAAFRLVQPAQPSRAPVDTHLEAGPLIRGIHELSWTVGWMVADGDSHLSWRILLWRLDSLKYELDVRKEKAAADPTAAAEPGSPYSPSEIKHVEDLIDDLETKKALRPVSLQKPKGFPNLRNRAEAAGAEELYLVAYRLDSARAHGSALEIEQYFEERPAGRARVVADAPEDMILVHDPRAAAEALLACLEAVEVYRAATDKPALVSDVEERRNELATLDLDQLAEVLGVPGPT